jgi:hypothetical protein
MAAAQSQWVNDSVVRAGVSSDAHTFVEVTTAFLSCLHESSC